MTEAQAREKSDAKVHQIKELADKLQVKISAEQAITSGNIIKSVIYFLDEEKYDIDKPAPVAPGPNKSSEPHERFGVHVGEVKQDAKTSVS